MTEQHPRPHADAPGALKTPSQIARTGGRQAPLGTTALAFEPPQQLLHQLREQTRKQRRQRGTFSMVILGVQRREVAPMHPPSGSWTAAMTRLAHYIEQGLRDSDLALRLDPSSLAVILEGIGDPTTLNKISARLAQLVEAAATSDAGIPVRVAHISQATYPRDGVEADQILAAALQRHHPPY